MSAESFAESQLITFPKQWDPGSYETGYILWSYVILMGRKFLNWILESQKKILVYNHRDNANTTYVFIAEETRIHFINSWGGVHDVVVKEVDETNSQLYGVALLSKSSCGIQQLARDTLSRRGPVTCLGQWPLQTERRKNQQSFSWCRRQKPDSVNFRYIFINHQLSRMDFLVKHCVMFLDSAIEYMLLHILTYFRTQKQC